MRRRTDAGRTHSGGHRSQEDPFRCPAVCGNALARVIGTGGRMIDILGNQSRGAPYGEQISPWFQTARVALVATLPPRSSLQVWYE